MDLEEFAIPKIEELATLTDEVHVGCADPDACSLQFLQPNTMHSSLLVAAHFELPTDVHAKNLRRKTRRYATAEILCPVCQAGRLRVSGTSGPLVVTR